MKFSGTLSMFLPTILLISLCLLISGVAPQSSRKCWKYGNGFNVACSNNIMVNVETPEDSYGYGIDWNVNGKRIFEYLRHQEHCPDCALDEEPFSLKRNTRYNLVYVDGKMSFTCTNPLCEADSFDSIQPVTCMVCFLGKFE